MSLELVDKDKDADENVDADQTRTGRPESGQPFTQLEEMDVDFRVPGLSHAVVNEAEHLRVQELVKKIELHPHQEALHVDLPQNKVYNPFSNNSKAMIRELTMSSYWSCMKLYPKYINSSQCLLKEFCTTLVDSCWLKALSIPNYVTKKEPTHGARHGKNEEQKVYHTGFKAWKRCRKRVDSQDDHYKGIHDRFQKDQVYRQSQLKIG